MDKRGSVEILAFILILPLLLMPIFNVFYSWMDIHQLDILKQVARDVLLQMEITGGLKSGDYDKVKNYLTDKNFNIDKLQIDYSPYPIIFGDEIKIKISYGYERIRFNLSVLGGIKKITSEEVMQYGPIKSTSKYYPR